MSDSYPTIQDALSEVQKDFMGCVEMHLDPPEHESPSYQVEAIFRCEADSVDALPGDAVRFKLEIEEDAELSERRHSIEFIRADNGQRRGWVRHRMKRVETWHGRFFWTESRFEVAGPGVPEGQAHQEEVEGEVRQFIEEIRRLDRGRFLTALPSD